jgi:hypothetical protein
MTLAGVNAALVAFLCVRLVAPGSGSGVGVVWHDQATVRHDARQRLLDAIAEETGLLPDRIVDDAVRQARQAVAHAVPKASAATAEGLEDALSEAAARYRAGALDEATRLLDGVEAAVRDDPTLPGATGISWRAHVQRAQIAGTLGDDAGVDAALRAAIALDPEARPSTRRVPPTIVGRHAELVAEALADRTAWAEIEVEAEGGGPMLVEIDGRPVTGPVPPGPHLVVVRRPGHAPVGRQVEAGARLRLPEEPPLVPDAPPTDADGADRICAATQVDALVLARERGGRLGLQVYACGEGFGAPWYADRGLDPRRGIGAALAAAPLEASAVLFAETAWPRPVVAVAPVRVDPRVDDTTRKPWFRRWWVWTIVVGVVAAGVTTGAVLGTRASDRGIDVPPIDEWQ